MQTIAAAVEKAGYTLGRDIYLGLDVASSEFFADGAYHLESEHRKFSSAEFADFLEDLVARYPIVSVEDGMAENDWQGWKHLSERLRDKIQLVGDDLFVTNTAILAQGIEQKIANSILIKPNQIGTLTETLAAIDMAKRGRLLGRRLASIRRDRGRDDRRYRRGAPGATQIKTGSLCRSDRLAKYNQLLRIERALGRRAKFDGAAAFPVSL